MPLDGRLVFIFTEKKTKDVRNHLRLASEPLQVQIVIHCHRPNKAPYGFLMIKPDRKLILCLCWWPVGMDVRDATSTTSMDEVKVGLEKKVGLEFGVIHIHD